MHFSTRTRYGLRFLLQLSNQGEGHLLQLSQIAKKESISPGYLEQIVRALRPLGILKAVRGSGGGYCLAKAPDMINLEDVIMHLEGDLSPVRCLSEPCERETYCATRRFWQDMDEHMRKYLRTKTLKDIEAATPLKECRGRRSTSHVELF